MKPKFDRAKIIKEMQKDSGMDDFIPITLRFHTSFYNKIKTFCEITGVKKAVLFRTLCEIGWAVINSDPETESDGETTP